MNSSQTFFCLSSWCHPPLFFLYLFEILSTSVLLNTCYYFHAPPFVFVILPLLQLQLCALSCRHPAGLQLLSLDSRRVSVQPSFICLQAIFHLSLHRPLCVPALLSSPLSLCLFSMYFSVRVFFLFCHLSGCLCATGQVQKHHTYSIEKRKGRRMTEGRVRQREG